MEKNARASKKQQELLQFIDGFIKGSGYGPSYREIMRALGYKSVSTVAIHVDQLIVKGYLEKKDNSARSLQVVTLRPKASQKPQDEQAIKTLEGRMQVLQETGNPDAAAVLQKAIDILRSES
jgi:SOS-response transcriptional repressor LexA